MPRATWLWTVGENRGQTGECWVAGRGEGPALSWTLTLLSPREGAVASCATTAPSEPQGRAGPSCTPGGSRTTTRGSPPRGAPGTSPSPSSIPNWPTPAPSDSSSLLTTTAQQPLGPRGPPEPGSASRLLTSWCSWNGQSPGQSSVLEFRSAGQRWSTPGAGSPRRHRDHFLFCDSSSQTSTAPLPPAPPRQALSRHGCPAARRLHLEKPHPRAPQGDLQLCGFHWKLCGVTRDQNRPRFLPWAWAWDL